MDLILTGRMIDAREALASGIANRVVSTGTGLGPGKIKLDEIDLDYIMVIFRCSFWPSRQPGQGADQVPSGVSPS